jgi:hypothetical protein
MTGKREDYMHITGRKKFSAALFQPAIASARLTLRAMPISAANGDLSISCVMESFFNWRVRSARCHVLTGQMGYSMVC